MPLSLADALLAFVQARNDLHTANAGADRTVGCVHDGVVYVVLLGKQGVCGITQGAIDAPPTPDAEPEEIAPAADTPKPMKRGRPKLDKAEPAAPIPGPGSAPAPAITKDALRAFARDTAEKTSVDAVKAILGGSIESLDPSVYAEKHAAIAALRDAKTNDI